MHFALTTGTLRRIMSIEKGAAESGSAQDFVSEQNNAKKPSLGRVAVSALYGDRDRISEDMERQRNRHAVRPYKKASKIDCLQ